MLHPVDKFAALIAHKVADGLSAGELYVAITHALSNTFCESVLSHTLFGGRLSSIEAADKYFDGILCRPVLLSGGVPLSITHKLLKALVPFWIGNCVIERNTDLDTFTCASNLGFVDSRLRQFQHAMSESLGQVSKGSAAASVQKKHGKLRLLADGISLELAEEISLWQILCALTPIKNVPREGEQFHALCRLFIDVMRTVHRPYQEIVMAGLYPFDWLDEVTTNQVRSVRSFLKRVEDCDGSWPQAWLKGGVTGYKTYDAFEQSELAVAIKAGFARRVDEDVLQYETDHSSDEGCLAAAEFEANLESAVNQGTIAAWEAEFISKLYVGEEASTLLAEGLIGRQFSKLDLSFDEWSASVLARFAGQ